MTQRGTTHGPQVESLLSSTALPAMLERNNMDRIFQRAQGLRRPSDSSDGENPFSPQCRLQERHRGYGSFVSGARQKSRRMRQWAKAAKTKMSRGATKEEEVELLEREDS